MKIFFNNLCNRKLFQITLEITKNHFYFKKSIKIKTLPFLKKKILKQTKNYMFMN